MSQINTAKTSPTDKGKTNVGQLNTDGTIGNPNDPGDGDFYEDPEKGTEDGTGTGTGAGIGTGTGTGNGNGTGVGTGAGNGTGGSGNGSPVDPNKNKDYILGGAYKYRDAFLSLTDAAKRYSESFKKPNRYTNDWAARIGGLNDFLTQNIKNGGCILFKKYIK